ncbi:MAG TPA: HEAT repeat domain-containing protein [Nitrospiraceae bacterium]|nr:HEAT repeat domain-containing protein [Nitrospiraceae bacterium]
MPKESLETLISELVHEEDWRRMRATAECVKGGPKAVDALIHALETGSAPLKMEIAGMLARIKDPKGGVPLVRLLRDEDEGVRKAGAIALEQMAGVLDTAAASALVEALRELKGEGQRKQVIALLGVIPNAIEPLTTMLKHPDAEARLTAATILEHLLDPRSADALVDVLGDPVVQDIAVGTLKKLSAIRERIDQAFDALRNVEESSEREEARMAIVIDLLGIGRPSVEMLIEHLQDDDWLVREAAADLLGKIGDVRAVEPLIERLRVDKDTGVKELAVKALGLIGDARPVELLVEVIPIRPLRTLAMEALAKVKDVEVLRPHLELFERLKTDRDGLVSYNAGMIVDKLAAAQATQGSEQERQSDDE